MTGSGEAAQPGSYPYGVGRLVPAWRSQKAWAFALAAALAAIVATWLRNPIAHETIDDLVLRVMFPALLAIVLALAPRPASRLGQIAKDFTVVSLIAAIFAGDRAPLMIASFPLVLAASVVCSRSPAARFWPEAT